MAKTDVFNTLNAINVNDRTEKKNGLTYLSWAWAWGEVKKRYPDATYTVYEDEQGWIYHTDGRSCWVKTGVTIGGIEHIEYLPVMDYKNKSIPADLVTSFDANKAVQRSLTKAIARHGLGLYIYAGEDLPEEEKPTGTATAGEPEEEANPSKRLQAARKWMAMGIETEFVLKLYGANSLADLTEAQIANALKNLDKIKAKQDEEAKA